MSAVHFIEGVDGIQARHQLESRSALDRPPPLTIVTACLDAALRLWDEDRFRAKSQIKVAAAMLRDVAEGDAAQALIPDSAPGTCTLARWQARKIKEFIDESLDSRIRLSDCASKVRLSNSYFSRAFKMTFGTTVCRYIRSRRVERAKQLMLQSQEPLSRIALACGFADQAHYCRVFRDVVGISPNTWRRRNMP